MLSRGNERKNIFHDDRDRLTFLDVIGEMAANYDVDIFAYGLMGQSLSYTFADESGQSFQKHARCLSSKLSPELKLFFCNNIF